MAPSIIIYGHVKIKSKSKGNGRDAITYMAPFHHIWPPSIIIYGHVKIKSKSKGNGRDAITYGLLQSSYIWPSGSGRGPYISEMPSHMAPYMATIIRYGPQYKTNKKSHTFLIIYYIISHIYIYGPLKLML